MPPVLKVMPGGTAPPATVHVIGVVPLAVNVVAGYAVPTVPFASDAGPVIAGAVPLEPGLTRAHVAAKLLADAADSWIVQKSTPFAGSTTVALKSPQGHGVPPPVP